MVVGLLTCGLSASVPGDLFLFNSLSLGSFDGGPVEICGIVVFLL